MTNRTLLITTTTTTTTNKAAAAAAAAAATSSCTSRRTRTNPATAAATNSTSIHLQSIIRRPPPLPQQSRGFKTNLVCRASSPKSTHIRAPLFTTPRSPQSALAASNSLRMSRFIRKLFAPSKTPEEMADIKNKVQSLIDENAVMVFSKSYCPYCAATKKKLRDLHAEFKLIELDQESDGSAMQDALEEINGQRTVPNIYIKQKHIGGNSELQSLGGNLDGLLKDAGALHA